MKCFLDLDGFLVMFHKPICNLLGKSFRNWPRGDSDLSSVFGMAQEEIFAKCNPVWWETLPKSAICDSAISWAELIFEPKNVYLATRPYDIRSYYGKITWVDKNLPGYVDRLIILKEKQLLANPHTVLFDDQDDNVNAFREAGGHGVLIPQPWNSMHEKANLIWEITRGEFIKLKGK